MTNKLTWKKSVLIFSILMASTAYLQSAQPNSSLTVSDTQQAQSKQKMIKINDFDKQYKKQIRE